MKLHIMQFFKPPVTFYLVGSNIILGILYSDTTVSLTTVR